MSLIKQSLLICFGFLTTHVYAANDIIISLKNVKSSSTGVSCTYYWEIKNNTSVNFTDFAYDFILKDGSGNIVDKTLFRTRLAPNSSVVADRLLECGGAKQIQYVGINNTTKVNGDYLSGLPDKNQILSIPVKIGSESALKVVK